MSDGVVHNPPRGISIGRKQRGRQRSFIRAVRSTDVLHRRHKALFGSSTIACGPYAPGACRIVTGCAVLRSAVWRRHRPANGASPGLSALPRELRCSPRGDAAASVPLVERGWVRLLPNGRPDGRSADGPIGPGKITTLTADAPCHKDAVLSLVREQSEHIAWLFRAIDSIKPPAARSRGAVTSFVHVTRCRRLLSVHVASRTQSAPCLSPEQIRAAVLRNGR